MAPDSVRPFAPVEVRLTSPDPELIAAPILTPDPLSVTALFVVVIVLLMLSWLWVVMFTGPVALIVPVDMLEALAEPLAANVPLV